LLLTFNIIFLELSKTYPSIPSRRQLLLKFLSGLTYSIIINSTNQFPDFGDL
jgi:hypothetical protein